MKDLFSELDVAGVRLANRIVLPPMATEQADADGYASTVAASHYGSLAATGVALVVVEHSCVTMEGRASPGQMSLASDDSVAGHAAIAAAIHAGGALCSAQISHAGSNRRAGMPGRCLGPSAVEHPVSHLIPDEMSGSDVALVVRAFGAAAGRVRDAGYDFVEVHCAHGYLLGEFLSPLTNRRSDAYGGTPAGRRRLLLEVIEEVRAAVHGDLPIMVRLGVADNPPLLQLYEGGLTVAEGVEAARALDGAGVAILDLSAGVCGSRPAGVAGEAYFRPFAEAVSAAVHCHVVCTGGITQPQTGQEVIQSGAADLVGVGRAIAADHDWVHKAREATDHRMA
ncbi:MAG TPA: NADH:flavin oxidoreductase [Clostridia bacterium]|nr:NADH:flavin oxidoreductase [Clostridia bacterium]